MRAWLTVEGFGLTPDDARADLVQRSARYLADGWQVDPLGSVNYQGFNPFAGPLAARGTSPTWAW